MNMKLFVAAAVCAAMSSTFGQAALVRFNFTAAVTQVDAPLTSEFTVGDTLSGFYVTDTTTPDTNPSSTQGEFIEPFTTLEVSFASGYSLSLGSTGSTFGVMTANDNPIDIYTVDALVDGASVGGFALSDFNLALFADTNPSTLLTSDQIPTLPPDLSLAVGFSNGLIRFGNPQSSFQIVRFNVTSLTGVPEPATVSLLLVAVVGGITLIRRRRSLGAELASYR